VNNPLLGEQGASQVFAPQKGANAEMTAILENNLAHFARKTFEILPDKNGLEYTAGAGAAGGLGFGLLTYMSAKMQKGVELVLEITQVAEKLSHFSKENRDFVITGEGRIDEQTAFGKVPWGVAQLAKKYDLPVIGICGSIGTGAESLYTQGIDSIFSILDKPMTLEEAMHNAPTLLERLGESIGRLWAVK
jgi:glycerate kinase